MGESPGVDWIDAQRAVDEWNERDGSRLSSQVEFVFGLGEEIYTQDFGDDLFDESVATERAADESGRAMAAELADLFDPGDVRWHATGVGRGAEGSAVGLILAATAVTGGVLTWLDAATKVREAWRRLCRRRRPTPTLSLGAARHLCLAHLADKIGADALGDVRLIGAAEVGPASGHELGHTGADLFCVVFASNTSTYVYLLDSEGGLLHVGEGGRLSASVAMFAGLDPGDFTWRPAGIDGSVDDAES